MIIVLSPSKTLDYTTKKATESYTIPEFLKESSILIKNLKQKPHSEIAELMGISSKLAELNYQRYKDFHTPFTPQNARQAILAFKGDVYEAIDIKQYNEKDFVFAQQHIRILSGLYGLLKPLDLIQPYRLEMGIALENAKGKNLYEFWGNKITKSINIAMEEQKNPLLVNLASQEYFAAIDKSELSGKLLNITFKEKHGQDYRIIGLFAKKARGVMADYIIKNRIEKEQQLTGFCKNGYRFNKKLSDDANYVFTRSKA